MEESKVASPTVNGLLILSRMTRAVGIRRTKSECQVFWPISE